jgi:hypothetical protein
MAVESGHDENDSFVASFKQEVKKSLQRLRSRNRTFLPSHEISMCSTRTRSEQAMPGCQEHLGPRMWKGDAEIRPCVH